MVDLSVILPAACIAGAAMALWWALSGPRRSHATLDLGRVGPATYDLREATLQRGVGERSVQPAIERLGRWARKYTPSGRVAALEQRLLLAGTPAGWTTDRLLALKGIGGLAGAGVGALQLLSSPSPTTLVVGAVLALIGFFGPELILKSKADKRKQEVRRALADTVDQLVIAVRAGLGLDAAIARVARTTEGPLAAELARAVQDTRAGLSRAAALSALSDRVRVPEVRQIVVALGQAEKLGVPIAQTLQVQASELRVKRRQHAEEKAMKLPVKILFPMVLFILPVLFIIILGPAALNISKGLGS